MISLIHPSKGRPQKSFDNAKDWINKAAVPVELIVSIDFNDPLKSDYTTRYFDFPCNLICEHNTSVVEATNKAARLAKGDILIYLSDDFKCFEGWGIAVEKEFQNEDRPLLVKVDDCLQKFSVPVLTIPIMNRALYHKLGYFWHPDYKSMFVDEDLYWTCQKLGAMKYAPHLKFPHHHVCIGKAEDDDTYRASSANWEQGKAVYLSRKSEGFPL